MHIRYTYHWRWGDVSTTLYDLSSLGSRTDLARVISKIKDGTETKDIVHHQFEEVKLVSIASVEAAIAEASK